MPFADRLTYLRSCKEITQDELAKAMGLTRGAVSMWESGLRFPTDEELLRKLADYFHVTLDYLLDRDSEGADSLPEELGVMTRLAERLSPEGRRQALQYIKFLHSEIDWELDNKKK